MLILLHYMYNIILRWVFETEHYDIAYGISCKLEQNEKCADDKSTKVKVSKEGSTEEIRQISRVNSQTIPEDGNITCHKPGICKLKQYSYMFNNICTGWSKNYLRCFTVKNYLFAFTFIHLLSFLKILYLWHHKYKWFHYDIIKYCCYSYHMFPNLVAMI